VATNDIKVVIQALVRGFSEVFTAAHSLEDLDRSGKAAGLGLARLTIGVGAATAAVGALGLAGKATWSAMEAGAQLQTTSQRFDKLSGSIGTTADVMLGKLREATRGMISDTELMASASQIMSLRLADNEGQVTRLATVVGTLGWDMQQVILTFANMSTMRLDALGLSVDEVKSKAKELEAAGMSASEAFKEAVIQAGEARLEIGGVSETEQSMKQAAAAVTNFKDSLLLSTTATLEQAGAFDALSNAATRMSLIQEITELDHALQEAGAQSDGFFANWVRSSALSDMSTAALTEEVARLTGVTEHLAGVQFHQGVVQDNATAAMLHGVLGVQTLTDAEAELSMMTDAVTVHVSKQADALYDWSAAVDNAVAQAHQIQWGRQAASGATGSMQDLYARRGSGNTWDRNAPMPTERATVSMRSYGGAASYAITQEDALAASHARLVNAFNAEMTAKPEDGLINAEGLVNAEAMRDALYDQASAAGASAVELAMLGIATGKFSKEQAAAALKAAILQEQIRKVAEGVAGGNIKYDAAVGYLEEFRQKLDASGGGAEDATANVEDLVGMAQELTEGPYQADINANTTQAQADLQAVLDLINGISGVHQSTIVVTTEEDDGGGATLAGVTSWPTYERPQLQTPTYGTVDTGRGGLHDWQSGGGIQISITNIVDGQIADRSDLDDVTTDKLLLALRSAGVA